jgi:hypothetical protein
LIKKLSENVKSNFEFYNGEYNTSDEIVKLKEKKLSLKKK